MVLLKLKFVQILKIKVLYWSLWFLKESLFLKDKSEEPSMLT